MLLWIRFLLLLMELIMFNNYRIDSSLDITFGFFKLLLDCGFPAAVDLFDYGFVASIQGG